MTKAETSKILAIIYAIYPRAYERAGAEATRDAWEMMFENETYEVVKAAVKKILQTSKFAPTISEVNAEISKYKDVLRARLRQYDFYFGTMPSECRQCTVKDRLEVIVKCGARMCPKEVSAYEKQQWFLTDKQVELIKMILK